MSEFVVDAGTREKLRALGDVVVVKDDTGRILGRFYAEPDPSLYLAPEAQDHGLSPEELARRLSPDAKTYTTAEVLAYLRGLK